MWQAICNVDERVSTLIVGLSSSTLQCNPLFQDISEWMDSSALAMLSHTN